jgi:hypothetical protein
LDTILELFTLYVVSIAPLVNSQALFTIKQDGKNRRPANIGEMACTLRDKLAAVLFNMGGKRFP